jgi:nondiscriminating glutamyl-tRNA synthetase
MDKIRVRFAPSPTGYMHVGNFRTALYGYLFAKQNGGDFILRIEDTDQKRYVKDALEKLINIINWAGFQYSEGVYFDNGEVIQKGNFGPYIQSERLDLYKKYAEQLMENGTAYRCFCTAERLEEMRNQQKAEKKAPMYDRCCLDLGQEEIEKKIAKGESYVIRQKIKTEGFTEYVDVIRGKVSIKNELLDDQILIKSDGYPTYNFANVVDDHLMEISHILRGEEYVSSTPKYIQLYQNFGWEVPKFAHLPLLLNPDKSKLSKRQGDVAVEDYIKKGYLKDAIINFVALLGWNPGEGSTREIFLLEELVKEFNLEKVHKGGAIFDTKKLDWINSQYIKKLPIEELFDLSFPFFQQKEFYNSWNAKNENRNIQEKKKYLEKVLIVEQERLVNLSEVGERDLYFFNNDLNYSKDDIRWKKNSDEETKKFLEDALSSLEGISEGEWEREKIEKVLLAKAGEKRGDLLFPLRWVLTGQKFSPNPFEISWVLGKEESLKRVKKSLKLFE